MNKHPVSGRAFALRSAAVAAITILPLSAAAAEDAPQIVDFKLDNGMEVVVIPDRRSPVVTHMLWYKVGSADEEAGKSGIAHFFEHLMFKGTSNHGPGEFSARIADVGGRENAFTSYDYTAYFQQVAPSELKVMMEFESDRMRNLVLTDDVIGPERDVIIEERNSRVESDPSALLSEEVNATLYQNHPYRFPVIGWMQEIEQLNRQDAIDFYDRFYAPNNAVLIVAGDVDAAEVRTLVDETYGKIKRGPDLPPRVRPVEPEQNTKRTVELVDSRVGVPSFSKRWVVPSYTTAEDGEAEALDILSELLGGGTRSRIYQELVVKQGIASSAGAFYQGTALDATSFGVYGSPRGDAKLEDVEKAIDAEIEKLAKDGVTQDELDKSKKRALRSMIFARDDQSGMARIYGAALTTGATVEDIAEWPDRINAVTVDDVKQAAERYLDQRRAVSGYLLPAEEDRS
jgi:zinc protease